MAEGKTTTMTSRWLSGLLVAGMVMLSGCGIYVGTVPPPSSAVPTTPSSSANHLSSSASAEATATASTSSPSPAANASVSPPTPGQIAAEMSQTIEIGDQISFAQAQLVPVTVADGSGGYLTAVRGARSPSADGYGQLVFFWHNQTFLGWDSKYESMDILKVWSPGPHQIAVSYAHYAATDGACCPSLPPVVIYYSWENGHLVSTGAPPTGPGNPIEVEYK